MMYATLAAQAAVIAFVLLLSGPGSIVEQGRREPRQAVERPLPAEPPKLRCRLYFGCVPN